MIMAGTSLIVVSVAAYVALAAGLVIRSDAHDDLKPIDEDEEPERHDDVERRARVGGVLALSGGVTAGVTMATGVPLVAIGRRRQARLVEEARVALMPVRAGAGVWLQARF
jgi:hypothetical protein